MAVALALLAIFLAGLALSMYGFGQFNKYQLTRQRCISAGQAQLDSIGITGQGLSDEDINRLWPNFNIITETAAGAGQWQGLRLVKVMAIGKIKHKEVKIELSRYVLPRQD